MTATALDLSIGQRVAFYRRRRGMTQVTLAGLVGRTESWIEKVENNRAPLDRVSVIRDVSRALRVPIRALLPADDQDGEIGRSIVVPALQLDYTAINPRFARLAPGAGAADEAALRHLVDEVWTAYQDSRFSYAVMRLNDALPVAYQATSRPAHRREAVRSLALLHHAAASLLVKVGDVGVARICAERGDLAAQEADDRVATLSLQRALAHTLLSAGQFVEAVTVVRDGVIGAGHPVGAGGMSALGTLMLVGATAAARAGERVEASAFLRHAGLLADRLGRDANELWTSFGPTNVAMHQVTVSVELDDVGHAVTLGSVLDVSVMPRERRTRHRLELARALTRTGENERALTLLLTAEREAPDQVLRHFVTRELVRDWICATRRRPNSRLVALMRRLGQAE